MKISSVVWSIFFWNQKKPVSTSKLHYHCHISNLISLFRYKVNYVLFMVCLNIEIFDSIFATIIILFIGGNLGLDLSHIILVHVVSFLNEMVAFIIYFHIPRAQKYFHHWYKEIIFEVNNIWIECILYIITKRYSVDRWPHLNPFDTHIFSSVQFSIKQKLHIGCVCFLWKSIPLVGKVNFVFID